MTAYIPSVSNSFLPSFHLLIPTHSLRLYFGAMLSLKTSLTLPVVDRFFDFILEPNASFNYNICSTIIIQMSAFETKLRTL